MKNKFLPMSSIEDTILVRMYENNKRNLRIIETELRKRGFNLEKRNH